MIDDLACIADTGTQSVEINAYINAKTSAKKQQYGVEKCYQIHVGGSEHTTPDLPLFYANQVTRPGNTSVPGLRHSTTPTSQQGRKNKNIFNVLN